MDSPEREATVARVRKSALIVLLLLVLWLAYRVVRPYLDPIILATVLAALLHPFFRWLRTKLGGRANLAAVLACALVLVLLLGPVALLAGALVREGIGSLHSIQRWVGSGGLERAVTSGPVARFEHFVSTLFPGLNLGRFDLAGTVAASSSAAAAWLLRNGGSLVGQAGGLLGKLVLMIFVLFYFLRDGQRLLTSTLHLIPLDAGQEERLIERFKAVSRSAILGAFGTAAAQGLAGGIGLAIVGLPGLFWGTVMALA
ncbi:MAG TPA: AI-2E family transporter, partial [Acidobacteria bacterium]|nr:AI-2E family transporter [Acidobacteriota bacterium]